jgi:hypothetical protein
MAEGKSIKVFGHDVPVHDVPVVESEEQFLQYKLEDGSIIKVKNIATNVLRVDDQYLPDGSPVYIIISNPVVSVISSPLKKASDPLKVN